MILEFSWREKQTKMYLMLSHKIWTNQHNICFASDVYFIIYFFKNQCLFPILVFYCPILLGSDKKEIQKRPTVMRGNVNIF